MRLDVVTIFPEYLEPLNVSLVGKAAQRGQLDVHVHDLRDWTHDRHNTVDDTPYGGGPGMVMKPEPWGEALDARPRRRRAAARARCWSSPRPAAARSPRSSPSSSPSGRGWSSPRPATRASTAGSSSEYATRMPVDEVSIGDYVLAGGEAAVLVIVEAVPGCCPACSATPSRTATTPSRPAPWPTCWRAPSTPSRPSGAAGRPRGAAQRPPRQDRPLAPRRGAAPYRRQPARPDRALRPGAVRQAGPRDARRPGLGGQEGPDGRFWRTAAAPWKNRPLLCVRRAPLPQGDRRPPRRVPGDRRPLESIPTFR